MMKILLTLFFLIYSLYSLEIEIKVGKSFSQKYVVYHITNETPIYCKGKKDSYDVIVEYICKIESDLDTSDFKKEDYSLSKMWIKHSDNNTFLHIQPLKKSLLYPSYQPLHSTKLISNDYRKPSKNWSLYLFDNNNTIFNKQKSDKGLDFDFILDKNIRPFIGALDIDKKPLVSNLHNEIQILVDLEELYQATRYKRILEVVKGLKRAFPNSTFSDDIDLYRLRALDGIDLESNAFLVLDEGEEWLNKNPSHEGIPEVLFYIANAQVKISRVDLAENTLKSLVKKHPNHKFAYMSKINLGDLLEADDDIFASIKLYKDVLYNTTDINIALMAAKRIADKSLDDKVRGEAKFYYNKILDKQEDYIFQDVDEAYKIAKKLRLNGINDVAGRIIETLSKKIDKENFPGKHEDYIFEAAQLFVDSNITKSIQYFQQYIDEYPEGTNVRAARRELDRLLFTQEDKKDPEDQLVYLDYIMKTYPDTDIAKLALYRKSKIMFSKKNYDFIFNNETQLKELPSEIAPDIEELIQESARLYTLVSLDNSSCESAVSTITKYNLKIQKDYHVKLYDCYIDQFRYKLANSLAKENIDSPESNQIFWLSALEKTLYKQQSYKEVIKISKELLAMFKIEDTNMSDKKYDHILFDMFDSYLFLGKKEEILKIEKDITALFPDDIRALPLYKSIANIGKKGKDHFLVIDMASKMFKIQQKHDVYSESPWIDYALIEAFNAINKYDSALGTAMALEKKITKKKVKGDLAKIYYTISIIYQNLKKPKEQSHKLKQCSEHNASKVWSRICRNTMKWL